MSTPTRFKLVFFVPSAALSACKTAIFAAGAGCYPGKGGYTEVAFMCKGMGQFRPGPESTPHIGTKGELEELEEVRVESICVGRDVAVKAVEALKAAHPYEEVAYEVFKMEDL